MFAGRPVLIPDAGWQAPESGCERFLDSKSPAERIRKINKNKGNSNRGNATWNGHQAAWGYDVDAF
jgi:hypothetical protein